MSTRSGGTYESPGACSDCSMLPSASDTETGDLPAAGSSQSSKPRIRASDNFWLIGSSSSSITGAKLPDNRQVMKYFLYLRHDPDSVRNKVSNEEIAFSVVDTVVVFWQMARIKTKTRKNCMLDVMSLWRQWDSLAKNKGREADPGNKRVHYDAKTGLPV
jgi:hypothetical protein